MSIKLIASPLQGFTDFRFRNAFNKHFGGIDVFLTPYIRTEGKTVVKAAFQRDIVRENNKNIHLIPQIMTKDADEFLFIAQYVKENGYEELNWNLGCPYPMVAKKGMGSGLLNDPAKIDNILKKVHDNSDIKVSVKMRLGYADKNEIFKVLPVLDAYPLTHIAIHPRIGKQLYKGSTDLNAFEDCIEKTKHKIYYNGDITSVDYFNKMAARFPSIDHWMIGRGIISDPFLAGMIKGNTSIYPENRIKLFADFHDDLFHGYNQAHRTFLLKCSSSGNILHYPLPTHTKRLKK